MPTPISDATVLLRQAIQETLRDAKQPLTSGEIATSVPVYSLGLSPARVHQELFSVFKRSVDKYPIERIRTGQGRGTRYGYYDPRLHTPLEKRAKAPVNGVNSDDFKFNPIELETEAVPTEAAPNIVVPAGVKVVRLTIAGVNIAIEFS